MVIAICVSRCCASRTCNGYFNCGRSFVSSPQIAWFLSSNAMSADTPDTVQHLGTMCLQMPVQLDGFCIECQNVTFCLIAFVGCTAVVFVFRRRLSNKLHFNHDLKRVTLCSCQMCFVLSCPLSRPSVSCSFPSRRALSIALGTTYDTARVGLGHNRQATHHTLGTTED